MSSSNSAFGRSYKEPSFLPPHHQQPRSRPGRRPSSVSQHQQQRYSSSESGNSGDEMFALSSNTPTREVNVQQQNRAEGEASDAGLLGTMDGLGDQSSDSSRPRTADPPPTLARRSRPIAIELPAARKVTKGPVDTPPEPLSARGDLPGGYFPNHEDPNNRIHRPHPFHHDVRKARHRSISLAAESTSASSSPTKQQLQPVAFTVPPTSTTTSLSPAAATAAAAASGASFSPASYSTSPTMPNAAADTLAPCAPPGALTLPMARTTHSPHLVAPVVGYMPVGTPDATPLPLGKYYPTNYEKRVAARRRKENEHDPGAHAVAQHRRASLQANNTAPASFAADAKADGAEQHGGRQQHLHHGPQQQQQQPAAGPDASEARRRLLQYQRDMVAQASLAASQLVRGSPTKLPASSPSPSSSGRGAAVSAFSSDSDSEGDGAAAKTRRARVVRAQTQTQPPPSHSALLPPRDRGLPASSTRFFALGGPAPVGSGGVTSPTVGGGAMMSRPESPKLVPLLGSPGGPMTPMELNDRQLGGVYQIGGAKEGGPKGVVVAKGKGREPLPDDSDSDRDEYATRRAARRFAGLSLGKD